MWTGIELLRVFQDIDESMPDIIDQFFVIIAKAEFQYFLPVILMAVLLWCFGRKQADLLMFNFGFSNIVGYVAKHIIQQPRPWKLDPAITPSQEAIKGAPGYSLPSGHTTSALSSFGTMAWFCRGNILCALFIALCVIIPFSRMYLGVHTPLDIIAAAAVTVAVCLVNYRILNMSYRSDRDRMYVLIGYAAVAIVLSIVSDVIAGKPLSNKMSGFCTLMPICILIKERYIGYDVPDVPLKERILPAIPGLIAVVLILEPIYRLSPVHPANIAMTTAIVFIILVYPMLLKRWQNGSVTGAVADQSRSACRVSIGEDASPCFRKMRKGRAAEATMIMTAMAAMNFLWAMVPNLDLE